MKQDESFRQMFEGHGSIMLLISPSDGRIIDANPAASVFYGYARQALCQMRIWDLNTLGSVEVGRRLEEARREKKRFFQFSHRLADGTIKQVEVHTTLVRTHSHGEVLFSIIHDATERIQAQEALAYEREMLSQRVEERTAALREANQHLEEAARLKDHFLANMSHELRTPLNGILTITEILREQLFGALNEKQQGYLRIIQESGQHLLSLINDILDLSRIQSYALTLQPQMTDLLALCHTSLNVIQPLAKKKHQRLRFLDALPPSTRTALLDPKRFQQILVNLLSNAVKFTPQGGEIGLEIAYQASSNSLLFTVCDNGIGIPPAAQEKLFQPFVQLVNGLDRPHEGSGLGLALTRRLVELFQGEISVQSTGVAGEGSRFFVKIPYLRPAHKPDDPDISKNAALSASSSPAQEKAPPLTSHLLWVGERQPQLREFIEALTNHQIHVLICPPDQTLFHFAALYRPRFLLFDARHEPCLHLESLHAAQQQTSLQETRFFFLYQSLDPAQERRLNELLAVRPCRALRVPPHDDHRPLTWLVARILGA